MFQTTNQIGSLKKDPQICCRYVMHMSTTPQHHKCPATPLKFDPYQCLPRVGLSKAAKVNTAKDKRGRHVEHADVNVNPTGTSPNVSGLTRPALP